MLPIRHQIQLFFNQQYLRLLQRCTASRWPRSKRSFLAGNEPCASRKSTVSSQNNSWVSPKSWPSSTLGRCDLRSLFRSRNEALCQSLETELSKELLCGSTLSSRPGINSILWGDFYLSILIVYVATSTGERVLVPLGLKFVNFGVFWGCYLIFYLFLASLPPFNTEKFLLIPIS